MFDALSPQRRRLVLASGALLLAVIVTVVIVAVVRSGAPGTGAAPQSEPGPVLLVPGYGGNLDSLAPLADALRSSGRRATVVPPIGDGTGDLRAEADQLGVVVEQELRETGAPSVDLIGYSAGGVVARLWVRDGQGAAGSVRRVLTLGSPQHGTSQAALGGELAGGCSLACTQLMPDSDLLRSLNAGDETPDGPQWATIRSTFDQVVTPTGSAALDGALNIVVQDVCPASTAAHGDLPGDPVTRAALSSVLGVALPRAPDRRHVLSPTYSSMSLLRKLAHAASENTSR